MRTPSALLLLTTLLLTACATSYQARPAKGTMGYYEQQLSTGRWEVNFNAQRQTDWAVIDQYLQRRATELATAQGWKGFTVLDQRHDKIEDDIYAVQTNSIGDALPISPAASPGPYGGGGGTGSGITPTHLENHYQIPFSYRRGTLLITPQQ